MSSQSLEQFDKHLDEAKKEVIDAKARVTELQRKRPREVVKDYTLKKLDGSSVLLSELFGEKSDLLLVHNMGKSCIYCTLWADGLNGLAMHLENRAAYVLVSNDDPKTAKEFSFSRGWTFDVFSGAGSDFTADMGFADSNGQSPLPGVSTFRKEQDGRIVRIGKAPFGPGDDFCAVWPLFDLLDGGARDWAPKYSYK